MQQERNTDDFELEPALTYNDELRGVRIAVQGIDCTVTAPMFVLAQSKGPITLGKDIPRQDLEALYDVELEQSYRLELRLEPIESAEP
jgi:hypothetical protein